MSNRKNIVTELKKKKIGVLLGGLSAEREISLKTGAAVVSALQKKGYKVAAVDADRNLAAKLVARHIDIAFIALHGRYGEDGCVQGLLEVMGIPYTGSGVQASAVCMDKVAAKQVMLHYKIPTPKFCVAGGDGRPVVSKFPSLPVVVKPASQGSALGVSIVRESSAVDEALRRARQFGGAVLVEEFIKGREFTVSILNGDVLPIIEILPKEGFYDYAAKYTKGATEFVVPAVIGRACNKRIISVTHCAYKALGCAGAARIDVLVDGKNRPYVLEVNTVPGLTELSLFPRAAAAVGLDYPSLVEEMLIGAGLNK